MSYVASVVRTLLVYNNVWMLLKVRLALGATFDIFFYQISFLRFGCSHYRWGTGNDYIYSSACNYCFLLCGRAEFGEVCLGCIVCYPTVNFKGYVIFGKVV
jgi:hypothetical protein